MNSRYLLRFDDIAPAMNWPVWNEIERIMLDARVKPVLAVVADNRDPNLEVGPREPGFWARVRVWQERGWTIGMHGYQHAYTTSEPGLLRLNRYSEFAGLPSEVQARKLASAIEIFRSNGVTPELWIAPAHSFDAVTLTLLRDYGFSALSDGFHLFPYTDRLGLTWIPQQLWSFRRRPFGTWTVCFHLNSWTAREIGLFVSDLNLYAGRITDFRSVLNDYGHRDFGHLDRIAAVSYRLLASGKHSLRAALRRGAAPVAAGCREA